MFKDLLDEQENRLVRVSSPEGQLSIGVYGFPVVVSEETSSY